MTWQESLRQLDARLTRGEIGAIEYRKVRDEILAEASSGSQAPNRQSRDDLWATAQAQAQAARNANETTLVVRLDPSDEEDEPTQVVAAEQIRRPPPPSGPPAAPVRAATASSAPPPNVRPTPYRSAPIQGQEIFTEAVPEPGRTLPRFLVPLVVLAVVGAGVWWFAFRDGAAPVTQPPPASTQQQASGVEDIAAQMPELPGRPKPDNGEMSLERARELGLFPPAYADLLADNGSAAVVYRGSEGPLAGYLLVASPIPPANGADGVTVLASEHLQRDGFAPAAEASPNDPPVITRTDNVFRTFIVVYSSGDVWIQLNASGPPGGDEKVLRSEFEKVLQALLERLPAD